MNVRTILTNFLHSVTPLMHACRRTALEKCVRSASMKNHLSVTSLGRNVEGQAYEKHRIKCADRLLSNQNLQREIPDIYQAITQIVTHGVAEPVLLVDWSDLDPSKKHFLLRAGMVCQGRSVTLYEEIHALNTKEKPATHRQFLEKLKAMLPPECKPVVVTDAGFRGPWFKQVLEIGWDYVGRVRHQTMYSTAETDWSYCRDLHVKATGKPTALHHVTLARGNPLATSLVLYKNPSKDRHSMNRDGQPRRCKVSRNAANGAKEPWVLATSLPMETSAQVSGIVKRYSARMQIEESFRDLKSERFGLGLNMHNTHAIKRLKVLILIGTLSCIHLHLIGLSARKAGLAKRYQANTETKKNVLGCVFLGMRILLNVNEKFEVPDDYEIADRFRQHMAEYAVRWAA